MRVPKVSTTSNQDATKVATTVTTNTTTTTTTTTAPKTGENVGIYVAELLSIVSAVGIGVYARKQRKEM